MPHFADRLAAAVREKKNAVLVGLDPRAEQLPKGLRPSSTADAEVVARAYSEFCRGVIDAVAPLVPAVKPQAAFFEQLGPAGMRAMAEVIAHARAARMLVIVDGKRNDIGSTAVAYAEGYLGPLGESAWGADALTVSPYLGDDSLTPFVETAAARGSGIFVLVKTSNPGGATFQDLLVEGRPLFERVGKLVDDMAARTLGACGYGAVGAVVGATYPEQLASLRAAMPRTWFLVPGFGAQGGSAADVAGAFDESGLGAIVNNSRGIIFAHSAREYAERFGPTRWQEAVEAATRAMIAELADRTPSGRLRACESIAGK